MVTGAGVEVAGGESAAAVGAGAEALCLAEEDEEGSVSSRLVNEATGPPFSHSLLFGSAFGLAGPSLSAMALPPLVSETARRASRRRVFSVSRLKWTLLKSLASLAAAAVAAASASLLVSLFHLAEAPGAGGAGGG